MAAMFTGHDTLQQTWQRSENLQVRFHPDKPLGSRLQFVAKTVDLGLSLISRLSRNGKTQKVVNKLESLLKKKWAVIKLKGQNFLTVCSGAWCSPQKNVFMSFNILSIFFCTNMQNTIEHADSHSVLSCKLDAAFIGQLFSQQLF